MFAIRLINSIPVVSLFLVGKTMGTAASWH